MRVCTHVSTCVIKKESNINKTNQSQAQRAALRREKCRDIYILTVSSLWCGNPYDKMKEQSMMLLIVLSKGRQPNY